MGLIVTAGRPRNKEPTKLLSVRVPASVFDPVKGFADDHAERMSAIVVEALQLYTCRVIENRCRVCSSPNQEDREWCGSCGAPLTDAAEIQYRKDVEGIQDEAAAAAEKAIVKIYEHMGARLDEIEAAVKKRFLSYEKSPDRPASATPRPDDEQTLDIDPE